MSRQSEIEKIAAEVFEFVDKWYLENLEDCEDLARSLVNKGIRSADGFMGTMRGGSVATSKGTSESAEINLNKLKILPIDYKEQG